MTLMSYSELANNRHKTQQQSRRYVKRGIEERAGRRSRQTHFDIGQRSRGCKRRRDDSADRGAKQKPRKQTGEQKQKNEKQADQLNRSCQLVRNEEEKRGTKQEETRANEASRFLVFIEK